MDTAEPDVICTPDLAPFFGTVPQSADLLHYAVAGFEIPSLPALPPENGNNRQDVIGSVLYRFRSYICELHSAGLRRSIALQFVADPEHSEFAARVRCQILCRSAKADEQAAKDDVTAFARQANRTFPQEGIFAYGGPRWLSKSQLEFATFGGSDPDEAFEIAEIRKHEEIRPIWSQPSMHYVPHRFWADQRRDPWLAIIETLAQATYPMAVRVELQPVRIADDQGLDFIALAGRWFSLINEDLTRKASQGEQVRTDGVVTEEMTRQDLVSTASSNAANISYIRRGRHIYEGLTTFGDTAFSMRVVLAARGPLPEAVLGSIRSALSTPPADNPEAAIGWVRPNIVRPDPDEADDAAESFRFMTQARWGPRVRTTANDFKIDLSAVVTPEEAVSLFHVPIYDRPGQTSALSTAEAPFVIPPETLAKDRIKIKNGKPEPTLRIGHMYQREKLLLPAEDGSGGQSFRVTLDDLMKPSLLVGAPGSGKTNLAFSLLMQLWGEHRIPFLVLDPSTGQEFRLLLGDPALKDELLIYTIGDRDARPFQFNPFSVPPGVTVRNHATRILAAFRAAYEMHDPIPAIYEAALERIYTDPRYTGGAPVMKMEDKGQMGSPAPTLSDFAAAIRDEVNEKAVGLYEGSKESIGVIRGASTIRVNAIGKKIGHIINVKENNGQFMQDLLKKPVVIELGALGDSSNISLVMAFLLTQLAGHIEHAFREDGSRQNVMFIEEAHRLLGASEGDGVESKSAEDLNMMLAEVRKFRQGILVMDQRPSSLVGGVLDNAYIKILTRLSDRVGFDRLSSELNLSEAHQRYARTRLKTGDAILLDRDAGQPVLMRSENVKQALEHARLSPDETIERMRANVAAAKLIPPDDVDYVEPGASASLDLSKVPTTSASPAATSNVSGSRDWMVERSKITLNRLVDDHLRRSKLFYAISDTLKDTADPLAAKRALEECLAEKPDAFGAVTGELREFLLWTMVGRIVEADYPQIVPALKRLRDAEPSAASSSAKQE